MVALVLLFIAVALLIGILLMILSFIEGFTAYTLCYGDSEESVLSCGRLVAKALGDT